MTKHDNLNSSKQGIHFYISILFLCVVFFLTSISCRNSRQQESTLSFFSYLSRGHEDITRFAIDMADQQLERDYGIATFYPPESSDTVIAAHAAPPHLSSNPIIYGNVATDFPEQVILKGVKLVDFYPDVNIDSNWLNNGNYQNFHFMRNFTLNAENKIVTVQNVFDCFDKSIAIIIHASGRAGYYWAKAEKARDFPKAEEGSRTTALFLIGHALHALQDSFSTAHTIRSNDLKSILDICVLGGAVGICGHGLGIDPRDDIWKDPASGRLSRGWSALTPEAQMAARVSARYLVHWAIATNGRAESWSHEREEALQDSVKEYLTDSSFDPGFSGFFKMKR